MVEMVRLCQSPLEEPVLDRRQCYGPAYQSLFTFLASGLSGHRRQGGYRLVIKNLSHRNTHSSIIGSGYHLDAQNGIAAQVEKVVLHSHLLDLQHLFPDLNQFVLRDGAGSYITIL